MKQPLKMTVISILFLFFFNGIGILSNPTNIELHDEIKITELSQHILDSIAIVNKYKNFLIFFPTMSPIKNKDSVNISSGFGWRKHPVSHKNKFHEGIDIMTKLGTKIFATASGKIIKFQRSKHGYGNEIVISHTNGIETLYAHLNSIYVKKGQEIKKGQLIGTVGHSGNATGSHLHYEVHVNGKCQDPEFYLNSHSDAILLALNQNK